MLLVALVPVVGTGSSFLSDEGAAIVQGRSLAPGKGWIVPHPLPELDPDGRHYPLVNSERGSRGFAPFAKHPAYAVLLAGAHRLGGVPAMVLLSVAGVVAAAALAGATAARFDPVLRRPAFWAVGLASPLLFNGFLVIGHTLGAALAAGAVLAAVVAVRERRPALGLVVAPCIAGAVLLRSEAVIFAGALGAVALVFALRARPRAAALTVAGAALASALAARALEAAWLTAIVGDAPPALNVPAPIGTGGFLRDRVDGFLITWLLPDYRFSQPLSLLLLVMVAALAVAAVEARTASRRAARVLLPAGIAAGAAVAAVIAAPGTVVPGLVVAFPALVVGIVLVRRALFRDAGAALAAGTSAVFAAGVLATQYATGGTGEWGGRYFALAIPVFVPVMLLALHRQGTVLERSTRHGALAALLVCSAALSTMAVLSVRSSHQSWSSFQTSIEQAQTVAGPGHPVITTWSAAPRFSWPLLHRSPWLLSTPADVGSLRQSVARLGFDKFVFVTVDMNADRPVLEGLDVLWSDGPLDGGRRILVVRESTAARPFAGTVAPFEPDAQ